MDSQENEEPIIKKKRGFFSNVFYYFREYCDKTSIHGFRYFGEKRRCIIEKIWWFITFTICLGLCAYLIRLMYVNWQNCPVLVSFATRETPIHEIPFAAVTICPESKLMQNRFNYTDVQERIKSGLNMTEQKKFQYISLVCDPSFNKLQRLNRSDPFVQNSTEFFEFLHDISPVTPILFWQFMGESHYSSKGFNKVLTDEGICYSFNMIDPEQLFTSDTVLHNGHHKWGENATAWTLHEGYAPSAGVNTYPRRAKLAGAKNSLEIRLFTPKEGIDFTCKNSGLQGYKVNFHIPQRVPRVSQQYFQVPLDQKVVAMIHPEMIRTSENVRKYAPHQRECYFSPNRSLRFFRNYTRLNCDMECLTNYTLSSCGCVNFFMPRLKSTPICGTENIKCMQDAESEMQTAQLEKKISKTVTSKDNKTTEVLTNCDCLPMCNDLTYNYQLFQTDWDWEKQFQARGMNIAKFNKSLYHYSHLSVYFSGRVITSERNELYGPTSFLANFGGLIGLFTGFSILSMVELIYFLSLRVLCNLKIYGFGNWSGRLD